MHIELHHIGITVGQVDEILDALRAAFGAERLPEPAAGHMLVRIGALKLALVERKDCDPTQRAFGDHLAFALSTAARDDAVRTLEERGWRSQEVRGRVYVQPRRVVDARVARDVAVASEARVAGRCHAAGDWALGAEGRDASRARPRARPHCRRMLAIFFPLASSSTSLSR